MRSGWLRREVVNSTDVPGRIDAGWGAGDGSALRLVSGGRSPDLLKRHRNELEASYVFVQRLLLSELMHTVLVSVHCPVSGGVRPLGKEILDAVSGPRRLAPRVTCRGVWILEEKPVGLRGPGHPGGRAEPAALSPACGVCVAACSSSCAEKARGIPWAGWGVLSQGAPPWGLEPSG